MCIYAGEFTMAESCVHDERLGRFLNEDAGLLFLVDDVHRAADHVAEDSIEGLTIVSLYHLIGSTGRLNEGLIESRGDTLLQLKLNNRRGLRRQKAVSVIEAYRLHEHVYECGENFVAGMSCR
jgi:hypothetical protein